MRVKNWEPQGYLSNGTLIISQAYQRSISQSYERKLIQDTQPQAIKIMVKLKYPEECRWIVTRFDTTWGKITLACNVLYYLKDLE